MYDAEVEEDGTLFLVCRRCGRVRVGRIQWLKVA